MRGMRYLALMTLAIVSGAGAQVRDPAPKPVAILAELFTSEGCSSCPPADDLLRRLVEEQPIQGVVIIGLSEHVDYWDRLGWKDPFSSAAFSRRQEEYSQVFGDDRIYTPQMIIAGRDEMVGSEGARIHDAIVKAAKRPMASVSVQATRDLVARSAAVRVEIRDIPEAARRGDLDVMFAVLENGLESHVGAGENAKRTLKHSAVTRRLLLLGKTLKGSAAGSFTTEVALPTTWKVADVRFVAFLQDHRTHEIHGAGSAAVAAVVEPGR
jgi:hypothetical protein